MRGQESCSLASFSRCKWESPAVFKADGFQNFTDQWLLNAGVLAERNNRISEKFLTWEKGISFWDGLGIALTWDFSQPFLVWRLGELIYSLTHSLIHWAQIVHCKSGAVLGTRKTIANTVISEWDLSHCVLLKRRGLSNIGLRPSPPVGLLGFTPRGNSSYSQLPRKRK